MKAEERGKSFEVLLEQGQNLYNEGAYVEAAKVWRSAVEVVPEDERRQENNVALFGWIADAYNQALLLGASDEVCREAFAVLDAHVQERTRAFPGETPGELVLNVREKCRPKPAGANEDADRGDAQKMPPSRPPPETVPAPTSVAVPPSRSSPDDPANERVWKGLAAGGGVALTGGLAMIALIAHGSVRAGRASARYDGVGTCPLLPDKAAPGRPDGLSGECEVHYTDWRRANAEFYAGSVLSPLLIGAGVVLVVLAVRKKQQPSRKMSPILGPSMVGWMYQVSF